MGSKLKVTSRPASAIRHSGPAFRTVGRDAVAKALGAEAVPREDVHGAPISLHALRRQLEIRVRSTGGRPSLEGATKIQKIPLKPEDWSRLEELAAHLSRQGVSATGWPSRECDASQAARTPRVGDGRPEATVAANDEATDSILSDGWCSTVGGLTYVFIVPSALASVKALARSVALASPCSSSTTSPLLLSQAATSGVSIDSSIC